jgi:PQQ-dependent dehydrogenase (methanol/ethanol family)
MKRWTYSGVAKALSAAAFIGFASQAMAADVTWDRLMNADKDPNNWLMYHQSFKGWHYSGLDQINASNVKSLKVAWLHSPAASKRGIQSFPLAVDGVLYYTSSTGQVWALDGSDGSVIWRYQAKIDTERAEGTFYNPYNRGLAIGYGKVYIGTVDGRMIALDAKTGKVVWDNMILSVEKGNKGFTGAPVIVKDKVIIGSNGGELSGCCGPIFAVNAQTGETAWQFDTIGGDERSRASWGNDSWKIGGGGGWMTGSYDAKTNTVWWGTANPAPDYDWAGENWKTTGPRPGDNLYSSSVVVLDADSGELKSYFQEMPHDAWDFDSAPGEFMTFEKGGKRYMLHPNKGGIIFVYNADQVGGGKQLMVENAYMFGETYNYIKGVDPKSGQLIGRRELPEGKHTNVCPAIDGAISWNTGSYNPGTGLLYKIGQEWCFDIEVVKADKPADFSGQAYFGVRGLLELLGSKRVAPFGRTRRRGRMARRKLSCRCRPAPENRERRGGVPDGSDARKSGGGARSPQRQSRCLVPSSDECPVGRPSRTARFGGSTGGTGAAIPRPIGFPRRRNPERVEWRRSTHRRSR